MPYILQCEAQKQSRIVTGLINSINGTDSDPVLKQLPYG